jgi:hypothetical protein
MMSHVLCKKGLLVDSVKIVFIVDFTPPTLVKQLQEKFGHMRY